MKTRGVVLLFAILGASLACSPAEVDVVGDDACVGNTIGMKCKPAKGCFLDGYCDSVGHCVAERITPEDAPQSCRDKEGECGICYCEDSSGETAWKVVSRDAYNQSRGIDAPGVCDDPANKCLDYYCDVEDLPAHCDSKPKCTPPPDKCNVLECDPAVGNCSYPEKCTTDDPCKLAECDNQGSCSYPEKCTTDDPCKLAECDNQGNCSYPEKCTTDDPCKLAECDNEGSCSYPDKCITDDPCKLAQCDNEGSCSFPDKCTTDDLCKVAVCQEGNCSYPAKCAPPEDKCLVLDCDPQVGGCNYLAKCSLPDDLCHVLECVPEVGDCLYPPKCKEDDNACTIVGCVLGTGSCTKSVDMAKWGCCETAADCEDLSLCTSEQCDPDNQCHWPPIEDCCCEPQPGPGCEDLEMETCVCKVDPYCCTVAWDNLCVTEVDTLPDCGNCAICTDDKCSGDENCQNCPEDCGWCPGSEDCCQAHDSFACEDPYIAACVCAEQKSCCTTGWTAGCVKEVEQLGCGYCSPDSCCLHHLTPGCGEEPVQNCVCKVDDYCCKTAWDGLCVKEVDVLSCGVCEKCGNGKCGGAETCTSCPADCGWCKGQESCCVAHESVSCADANVSECVCNGKPDCCTGGWDQTCVDSVEALGCSDCSACCTIHETQGCADKSVQECVCSAMPECCTASWDEGCVDQVDSGCGGCSVCGDGKCTGNESCETCPKDCGWCPGSEGCCEPHDSVSCIDPGVTACVCAWDPYCCQVHWDNLCVLEVETLGCGYCAEDSCCLPHDGTGCDDPTIEECVCDKIQACCTVAWDDSCVTLVESAGCGTCALCGDGLCSATENVTNCYSDCPGTGDCCIEKEEPGCSELQTSGCVCSFDSYCCQVRWDRLCVEEVEDLGCGQCP